MGGYRVYHLLHFAQGSVLTSVLSCRLVVSQFPPSLMEMLVLIAGGGLDLDRKSILEGT
jgi:hypothetical protein